jgi:hypothetical protein
VRKAQIADLVLWIEPMIPAVVGSTPHTENRFPVHVRAGDLESQRFGRAVASHFEGHHGVDSTAQRSIYLGERHVCGRGHRFLWIARIPCHPGNLRDDIARAEACLVGRTIAKRKRDARQLHFRVNFDADADVAPGVDRVIENVLMVEEFSPTVEMS